MAEVAERFDLPLEIADDGVTLDAVVPVELLDCDLPAAHHARSNGPTRSTNSCEFLICAGAKIKSTHIPLGGKMSLKSHSQMSLTTVKFYQFNTSDVFEYYYESYPNSAK